MNGKFYTMEAKLQLTTVVLRNTCREALRQSACEVHWARRYGDDEIIFHVLPFGYWQGSHSFRYRADSFEDLMRQMRFTFLKAVKAAFPELAEKAKEYCGSLP